MLNRIGFFLIMTTLSSPLFADLTEDLLRASRKGDIAAVQSALEAGANVNGVDDEGNTALMHALLAEEPSAEIVKVLIKAKADVNARNSRGATALYYATPNRDQGVYGSKVIMKILKAAGAKYCAPAQYCKI
jgi:hypothetical protein